MTANHPSSAPGNYHHGNLRTALLEAAVIAIREQGPENLSLRAIARHVGVSQTAPYRHFDDKNGLLAELARQTFDEITNITMASINPELSAGENLIRAGETYLRYATAHPEKYRLIFGNSIPHREQYQQLCDSGNRSFNVLFRLMEQGIESGEFLERHPMTLANTCWCSIHGFASLSIDGIFNRREQPLDNDAMMHEQTRMILRAISR